MLCMNAKLQKMTLPLQGNYLNIGNFLSYPPDMSTILVENLSERKYKNRSTSSVIFLLTHFLVAVKKPHDIDLVCLEYSGFSTRRVDNETFRIHATTLASFADIFYLGLELGHAITAHNYVWYVITYVCHNFSCDLTLVIMEPHSVKWL